MSMRRNWTRRVEQRAAEVAKPMTPVLIEQAQRRAAAPDLGRDADVIDMYEWAEERGKGEHLASRRNYIGLTHMNIASHGLDTQVGQPLLLRIAS